MTKHGMTEHEINALYRDAMEHRALKRWLERIALTAALAPIVAAVVLYTFAFAGDMTDTGLDPFGLIGAESQPRPY